MLSLNPALISPRVHRQMICLAVAAVLSTLFFTALPPVAHQYQWVTQPVQQATTPVNAAPAAAQPAQTTQTLPPGLGPVLNATLAADSGQGYAALASSPDTLRADNPAQRFATTFTADGINVAPAGGPVWTMRATALSTADENIPLVAIPPTTHGLRVEYRRDGLTEWYINGPNGMEQGFTLDAPPAGAARFALALAVTDATATQANTALMIGGLRYSDLTAMDATGATLPAHLDTADGAIRIAVDARGAQWPVTIDPLITQAALAPQTPAGNTASLFGISTAIATASGTNTIVVGASSELVGTQDGQGAAYVFTGSGSTYTQRARLTASDGARQNQFGQSVAVTVSGGTTTVVVGTLNVGKAYVYTSSGGAYTEQARLVSPDPSNGDNFGVSVAAATNGATTIIAVGAMLHMVGANNGQGTVYLFAGSGRTYPLQLELNDPTGVAGEQFGYSVTLVSGGGTNTLAVGAPEKLVTSGGYIQGSVLVFTGSGASYSAVSLTASNGQPNTDTNIGHVVAVGVLNGVTTVASSDPPLGDRYHPAGSVFVFTGSGTSYTTTRLVDADGANPDAFGGSVAVGYSYSQTLVAVGAPGKNARTGNPADGVLIFTQDGTAYAQSSLPELSGQAGDYYGESVAMATAPPTGDPVVVGGAIGKYGGAAQTGTATVSSWSAQASVRATFGDGAQTVASPAANNYSGTPFHLAAAVVDGNGNPIPPTGITFIVNTNGGAGGVFNAADPTTTILHTTTNDGTVAGTTAGQTGTISLYPSSTVGSFTVTATADGTALGATYTLKIIPSVPKPTINPVIPARTTSAAKQGPAISAAAAQQPPGLSPAMVIIDPNVNYGIHVTGAGFVSQVLGTTAYFQHGLDPSIRMDTTYNSATDLTVYVSGPAGMFNGITADTTATITVYNPPSSAGAGDGGFSNPVTLVLALPRPAPANSALACSGSLSMLAVPGALLVPAPCQVLDAGGVPVPSILTGKGTGFVGSNGGELVGNSGGTIISEHGAGVVSHDGGSVVSHDGGSVISNDGGSLVASGGGNIAQMGAAKSSSQSPVSLPAQNASGGAPIRTTVSSSPTGDYIASTDAHGIIMAPPVASNGIPGTFTRTLSIDGITKSVTYTITNLNPHDGHPATITSLSRTSAHTGDPAFTLTATGTGFVTGSVLSYGGVQLATAVDSATQLHATIPADLLLYRGALDVLVINPDPNGGASLPATFTVTHATTMTLTQLSPNSVAPNGPAFTLTATGTNFVNGATVQWNGAPLATTYVSATALTATVPATLTAHGGTAQVTVADPLGGATGGLTFTVLMPTALPAPQPGGGGSGVPSPLPGSRQPAGQPLGNPSPLPPSR